MTLQEYFSTPKTVLPQELIYGDMRVADAPFVSHQRVVFRLAMALQMHAEERGLGEVFVAPIDVVLDQERGLVVQPDLLFVSEARRDLVRERIYGPPDLVVEILSPSPRIGQLEERIRWFAQYGVREIWVFSQPRHRMEVLRCSDGGVASRTGIISGRILSAVLPDFLPPVESMRSEM